MGSLYLQPIDYDGYGVPDATTQQVSQASAIIDGFLQRQEGLIWRPDANGNPCYMAARVPIFTLTATAMVKVGVDVSVTTVGPMLALQIGSVAILDRDNPQLTEACVVTAINGNTITLAQVQFDHVSNTTLDFGLTLIEERTMPEGRPLTMLSRTPVASLLSGQGRYGYGRRSHRFDRALDTSNLLATVTRFGGPPVWELWDALNAGLDPNTGQVWIPAGLLLAYYTEIRIHYIVGWTYALLPTAIKQACANIINAATQQPMNGSVKSMRAGDTGFERFSDTYLDTDTKNLLNPYRVHAFV